MPDFTNTSLVVNIAIFTLASVVVWFAGARITGYANAISGKTGIGQGVIGMLLLGGVTSLPEIGATITSAAAGAADLAVNNLFGSISAQVVILAIVDQVIGKRALTAILPDPMVILQGTLGILLLTVAVAGMVVGDTLIFGIGAWAWVSAGAYAFCVYLLSATSGRVSWIPAHHEKADYGLAKQQKAAEKRANVGMADRTLRNLVLNTSALAGVILVAGYLLSRTADAMTAQLNMGGNFMGYVVLAFATSLPEFSTAITAARAELYTLAVSDILGTNLINVGLIFVLDLVASGEPVLNQVGTFATFGALLGIALTALFVIGMAERGDKTVWRMGLDSAAVLVCYALGLGVLFFLRG